MLLAKPPPIIRMFTQIQRALSGNPHTQKQLQELQKHNMALSRHLNRLTEAVAKLQAQNEMLIKACNNNSTHQINLSQQVRKVLCATLTCITSTSTQRHTTDEMHDFGTFLCHEDLMTELIEHSTSSP